VPNHVTNILNAPKEVLDALAGLVTDQRWRKGEETRDHEPWGEERDLWTKEEYQRHSDCDFGKVIPEPENINREAEGLPADANGVLPNGKVSWYWWNTRHWGTKWNAYDIDRRDEAELKFETAWSHPMPVVKALSQKFPETDIRVRYADEDLGNNLGEYTIRNGEVIEDRSPGKRKREDFACLLVWGKSYAEYCAERDAEEEAWEAEQAAKEEAKEAAGRG